MRRPQHRPLRRTEAPRLILDRQRREPATARRRRRAAPRHAAADPVDRRRLLPVVSQGAEDDAHRDPFASPAAQLQASRFGLHLFLASLTTLFIATLTGFAVLRFSEQVVWPTDLPAPPALLWLSTGVLAVSSVTMQAAVNSARRGRRRPLRRLLAATVVLAVMFLGLQAAAWGVWSLVVQDRLAGSEMQRFAMTAFFVLTGIHALHVVGGLVPMLLVTVRAFRGRYTARRHEGVAHVATYWHFLGVVWLVLYVTLLVGV